MLTIGHKIETTSSNFGKKIIDGHLIVDKTLMIKEFWEGQDVSLIIRPRRFGKTLNLSMLHHFFAAEVAGASTKELFNKLAIAQTDEGAFLKQHQGQHPVIFITLKDIKEPSYEDSIEKFKILIQELYIEHKSLLALDTIDANDKRIFQNYLSGTVNARELEESLKFLSSFLHRAVGKKAIILIDEYDAPLMKAHEGNFLEALSDFIRNLLSSALKDNNHLEKGLMTGILRVSKNSMLSGLNNLEVYSLLDAKYGEYFGFTESEVNELIGRVNATNRLEEIRQFYNGYLMSGHVVYNPWSSMNYLSKKQLRPYWVLTSNDQLLKNVLLRSNDETKIQLGLLMQGETIEGEIDINLSYEDLIEKPYALWSLLLFCGYLTIDNVTPKGSRFVCQLKVPNKEVRIQYTEIFSDWLKERVGMGHYNTFLKSLVEGRVEEFTKKLTSYLFACTSNHDFQAESDYHTFVLGLLASITETHMVYSNKEYGIGRPDCLLIPKDPTKNQGVILEFKHVHFKKSPKDIKELKQGGYKYAQEALEQINMRVYGYAFSQYTYITEILKIGISFCKRLVSSGYIISGIKDGVEAITSLSKKIHFVDSINQALEATEAVEVEPVMPIKRKEELNERTSESEEEDIVVKRRKKIAGKDFLNQKRVASEAASSLTTHSNLTLFDQKSHAQKDSASSASTSQILKHGSSE